jgi:hypothetical protein
VVQRQALDSNDRYLAVAAWAGLFCGGPILPLVILAARWSTPASLARQHALVASVMWAVVLVVYVPLVVRMALVGEPDGLFFAVWGAVVAIVVVMSGVGALWALRAPDHGPSVAG